jgi:hypothetical protein
MDVVIFAVVVLAVAAFVAAPLYAGDGAGQSPASAPPAPVGDPLLDLEIDRESGLLTDGEYRRERADLEPPD